MGHRLRASLLGTLAVTALRNARRTGLALADQLRQADRVLHPQFGGGAVRHRALAVRIDLATGSAEVESSAGFDGDHQAWRNIDGGTKEVPGGTAGAVDPDDVGRPAGPGVASQRVPADR